MRSQAKNLFLSEKNVKISCISMSVPDYNANLHYVVGAARQISGVARVPVAASRIMEPAPGSENPAYQHLQKLKVLVEYNSGYLRTSFMHCYLNLINIRMIFLAFLESALKITNINTLFFSCLTNNQS